MSPSNHQSRRNGPLVRFERHASRVVYDQSMNALVVSWSKGDINSRKRLEARKDLKFWKPSVDAVLTLWDRMGSPEGLVFAVANAVRDAYETGDRSVLDTEAARKAASLVCDLMRLHAAATESSSTTEDISANDVRCALRRLMDEMAVVRFSNLPESAFAEESVLPQVVKALTACYAVPAFTAWVAASCRRRFLYELSNRGRTEVVYALAGLFFAVGSCPLLTASDRVALRDAILNDLGPCCNDLASTQAFFREALARLRALKHEGKAQFASLKISPQKLADSLPNKPA